MNFLNHNAGRHESPGPPGQPGLDFSFLTWAQVNVTEASAPAGILTQIDNQVRVMKKEPKNKRTSEKTKEKQREQRTKGKKIIH